MIYQSVSMQEVIARVVRNTGVQDASYILPMDEWIPEAMGIMKLRQQTTKHWADVEIHFHKAQMPCDLYSIEAIEHGGRNLLPSNSLKIVGAPYPAVGSNKKTISTDRFISMPQTYEVAHSDGTRGRIFDSNATPLILCSQSSTNCQRLPPCDGEWYQIEMPGYVTTSFRSGWIRIHHKRIPVDEDGLPLIPDNENFKQALYWYTRAMMVGRGWEDPIVKYRDPEVLFAKFELAAGRAAAEITYPTDGELELAVRNGNRLIKDENYFDRFFETPTRHRGINQAEVEYSDAQRVVPNMPVPSTLAPGGDIFNETPIGLVNGSNKLFTTIHHYVPGTLAVYRNGILQKPGLHYSYDGVNTFTFTVAPLSSPTLDVILINYTMS